jgi:DNA polymerase IV
MKQYNPSQKIIHIDMDAFFASVEQRDNPSLRGKPVAVGGSAKRGVVATASYEARKYGVRSAMPSVQAARKCPGLIFVKSHFSVYQEDSHQIMQIFKSYTHLVEPLSLDEAFLDVTQYCKNNNITATKVARQIKNKIKKERNLTASAGVSFNKFLAKIASGWNKPDGLKVIQPSEASDFIDSLPVGKVSGIGKVTREKMNKLGIETCLDLKNSDKIFLSKNFGKSGRYFYDLVHLKYFSEVKPSRIRKSLGAERTFFDDISDVDLMLEKIQNIAQEVSRRLNGKGLAGRTLTLKIKYHDFEITSRSRTLLHYLWDEKEIFNLAKELLTIPLAPKKAVRLLGIQISNLNTNEISGIGEQLKIDFVPDYY